MADPKPQAKTSQWILDPLRDSLLFVATPVVILPVTLLLLTVVESKELRYAVLAFGAMGHNLPGMLRAYGDRALFRALQDAALHPLAPIVLGVVCFDLTFAWRQSSGHRGDRVPGLVACGTR